MVGGSGSRDERALKQSRPLNRANTAAAVLTARKGRQGAATDHGGQKRRIGKQATWKRRRLGAAAAVV